MFSDNIDVEIGINPLLDNFENDSVVLLFFPSLDSCSRISTGPIYYILDLFLLEYSLGKIGPLRPILEVLKLLSFTLTNVVFVCHLEKCEKCSIGAAEHISDLIT